MLKLRKGNIRLQKTEREDSKKQNIKINILLIKKKKKKNIRETDRQLKEIKGKSFGSNFAHFSCHLTCPAW